MLYGNYTYMKRSANKTLTLGRGLGLNDSQQTTATPSRNFIIAELRDYFIPLRRNQVLKVIYFGENAVSLLRCGALQVKSAIQYFFFPEARKNICIIFHAPMTRKVLAGLE